MPISQALVCLDCVAGDWYSNAMTSTMNHSNCTHPATKAGRALCRRIRASQTRALRLQADELIYQYYQGTDFEEVIYPLMQIFPAVKNAYFDTDSDAEELIALANREKFSL